MKVPWLIRPVPLPATTPPPLTGVWSPEDTRLDAVEILALPRGHGPEDVAAGPSGEIYSGTADGAIWQWPPDAHAGTVPRLVADTGGRPLGIEFDPRDDSLIVCDADRGLLRLTVDGIVTELTRHAGGTPILFCNNAAVARDGVVYFSDSSNRFPVSHWRRDLLEHRPNGRILAYHPADGRTEVIAEGLHFPNGVALTPAEDELMVCETVAHRLIRLSLPDGRITVLCDLPAYPDNMSPVGDGTFWIALASPRVAVAERLLPHPRIRQAVAVLPPRFQPKPLPYTIAALVDRDGRVLRALHGPAGRYVMATGVRQHGDTLWLGSLTEAGIARVGLRALRDAPELPKGRRTVRKPVSHREDRHGRFRTRSVQARLLWSPCRGRRSKRSTTRSWKPPRCCSPATVSRRPRCSASRTPSDIPRPACCTAMSRRKRCNRL